MKHEIKKWLYDILNSVDSIYSYIGNDTDFTAYQQNKMMRRAVERELEIIGEATNKILKIVPDINIENARRIIDTRNWVIHSYDNVDDVIIWGIINNHLPKLREEIEQYLTQEKR